MRWSKIKNIIILLLVIVNLFLLSMVGVRSWQSREQERETWQQTVALAEKRGLTFLPREMPQAAMPGRVNLTPEGPLEEFVDLTGHPTGEDPAQAGLELLAQLGYEGKVIRDNGSTVEYAPVWNGLVVHGWSTYLTYDTAGFLSAEIRPLRGGAETQSPGSPISAATALTRFMETLNEEGYVCSQVVDLYPGYTVGGGAEGLTLNPVWYVETDAQPRYFAVDGYTGGVTTIG